MDVVPTGISSALQNGDTGCGSIWETLTSTKPPSSLVDFCLQFNLWCRHASWITNYNMQFFSEIKIFIKSEYLTQVDYQTWLKKLTKNVKEINVHMINKTDASHFIFKWQWTKWSFIVDIINSVNKFCIHYFLSE